MKSATKLKNLHKRIQLLKGQRSIAWIDWHKLNDKEKKSDAEKKEFTGINRLITSLNYEIKGLERTFNEVVNEVVNEIINS